MTLKKWSKIRIRAECQNHEDKNNKDKNNIRWAVAHDVAELYSYKYLTIAEAAKQALDKIAADGGTGGIIAIDSAGNITMPFNTKGMMRGSVSSNTEPFVAIY